MERASLQSFVEHTQTSWPVDDDSCSLFILVQPLMSFVHPLNHGKLKQTRLVIIVDLFTSKYANVFKIISL